MLHLYTHAYNTAMTRSSITYYSVYIFYDLDYILLVLYHDYQNENNENLHGICRFYFIGSPSLLHIFPMAISPPPKP